MNSAADRTDPGVVVESGSVFCKTSSTISRSKDPSKIDLFVLYTFSFFTYDYYKQNEKKEWPRPHAEMVWSAVFLNGSD